MAQGDFTKEEAKRAREAVNEMFNALTRNKKMEYLGHLNDILLFLEAAGRHAPDGHYEQTLTPVKYI